ncbi:proteasome endopeptidase complex, archaeal, alpha subunit [Candidatus Micrarchaeota archaeon CG08_land_8_20_14_0_20_49_17]|nr:MAG: proteasome endopeptidase complex, archaeal, alpha subunit [Candidatus Micrarchaeota archaeon CG1_02_49_24]PIU09659.1 MAG: proteasome endopeptidase complex, archaeal, alpha subunit [Candidatus Micrarchaeota archaeon CG08_land_8_20_14_0_20_49_17]PIZ98317.1 MAG: proteasome endopeptidase complex, archaeal, alpha subunit [Candidatus Micrarchaeota archaeon CG_4_10_14_0_2_um_filter_49_7]HII53696.1 archaeal proteasome endopeptidase complex subunit alpha [Candidatus Micrarchaeota archaeon]
MYPASNPQAYDRAITVFSPDGRLFQVEYAKEAVRRGATAMGVVCKDGMVLVAHKSQSSKLLVTDSLKKIFEIDTGMALTASGLIADARRLIDMARLETQRHRLVYAEAPTIEYIAKSICDTMQIYTQYGGIRPFGVSLLLAGVDDRPRLFEIEPSGALTGFLADSIGSGKKEVDEYLEKEYKESITVEDGISLCVRALKKGTELELTPPTVEIGAVTSKVKKFQFLSEKEVEKYLKK